MPNKKTGGKGAELHTGQSNVKGAVDSIIEQAQNQIKESEPKEVSNVDRSKISQAWLESLGGQARGAGARIAEDRAQGREGSEGVEREAQGLARPARFTRNAGRFAQPDAHRIDQHEALAKKEGLKHPEAFQPHTFRDKLTQWFTDRERAPTIDRAKEYLEQHPEADATYAAADVGNLGGLNDALGRRHADEVFKGIANIFADRLHRLGGDVVLIRHGGDEFSAVVVGADHATVENALTAARREVAQYIKSLGLDKLPHSKDPTNPERAGVGMYTASERISGKSGLNAHGIIDSADAKIELAKNGQKAEADSQLPESTDSSSEKSWEETHAPLPPEQIKVPGGGLRAHEKMGGHTLKEHVEKTANWLLNRLGANKKIKAASSFYNEARAEEAIGAALKAHEAEIKAWIDAGNKGKMPPIDFTMPEPVGITVPRGSEIAQPARNVRIIIKRAPESKLGYYVLTGFPIL